MAPQNGYFDTVFALAGDVTAVPDANPGDGSVSYDTGFGVAYSTAVSSGGLNFPRAQNNQLLKDVTTAIQLIQQNGCFSFITSAMNGGTPYSYVLGATCLYDAGSGLEVWLSVDAANADTPGSSSKWVVLGSGFLKAASNLSDLGSLPTALTNLGFGGNSTSYVIIPNPNNTAKPTIIQWGTATGQSSSDVLITLPVAYPNAFEAFPGYVYNVGTTPAIFTAYGVNASSPLTSFYLRNNSGSGNAVSWLTIGN